MYIQAYFAQIADLNEQISSLTTKRENLITEAMIEFKYEDSQTFNKDYMQWSASRPLPIK